MITQKERAAVPAKSWLPIVPPMLRARTERKYTMTTQPLPNKLRLLDRNDQRKPDVPEAHPDLRLVPRAARDSWDQLSPKEQALILGYRRQCQDMSITLCRVVPIDYAVCELLGRIVVSACIHAAIGEDISEIEEFILATFKDDGRQLGIED
jgi:hypothetical protein